jgi:hypothetical protein
LEIPPKEFFEKNLEFLRSRMAEESFSELTANAASTPTQLTVLEKDGKMEFRVRKDSKDILLHSRRDPEGEAERQINSWAEKEKIDWKETIVVFGFSGMHHILAISKRLKPEGMLFIADNTKNDFLKALEYCDLYKLEETGANICFSVSDRHDLISNEYRYKLRHRKRLKTNFFVHPGAHRAYAEKYDFLFKSLAKETRIESLNRGTSALLSETWQKNALKNLPWLLSNSTIDVLKNAFKDCTGLVIGAGPSLNNSLQHIRKVQDEFLIIAVGTALKPLLNAGIVPDLTVALDSNPVTLKQYEGLPTLENLFLCATTTIDVKLIEMFSGRLFLFTSNILPGQNEWLDSFNSLPERLSVAGTVTFTATDLARHMGCTDIVFAGFDLCMKDDGTTHANGSVHNGEKSNKGDLIEIQGNYGKNVLTTRQFRIYIDMLNSYLYCETHNNNACFRNATNGGALLNHAPAVLPETLVGMQHKIIPEDKKKKLASLFKEGAGKKDLNKAAESVNKTLEEMQNIINLSDNAIEACRILGNGDNINYSEMLKKELDKIDKKIKENHLASILVNGALQPLIMEIFSEEDSSETPAESLAKNLNFYTHVKETSSELKDILENSSLKAKLKNK